MSTSRSLKDHVIIGTAGHIDHGKTRLVKALTGIDADTLAEEKRRGITIELGFVFLEAPESDKQIMFIDVPGHEKLVKTMVAGASNIDAALLVIAADEGINVQTREHFDILKLLGISRGLIALTKTDLVDSARIEAIESELKGFVADSFLANAPVFPVSAVTGAGIEALKAGLVAIAAKTRIRPDSGIFRMPIDRVFTMRGFGTVIAGTVLSGEVKVGDEIEIFPEGLRAKVRNVHVHHEKTDASRIGKRTAVNLLNISREDLRRGQCAARPGSLTPSFRMDGRLHLLKNHRKGLKTRDRLRLHTGTSELICRIVLLDRDKLEPGESGYVQFVLEAPGVAVAGDRFVVRTFSPLATIGGGQILDAHPEKHKRSDEQTQEGLERLEGSREEQVEQALIQSRFTPLTGEELSLKIGAGIKETERVIEGLLRKARIVSVGKGGDSRYLHKSRADELAEFINTTIRTHLENNPGATAMPYVELRSAALKRTDDHSFKSIVKGLADNGLITKDNVHVGLVGYEISLEPHEKRYADALTLHYRGKGFLSPIEEEARTDLNIPVKTFRKVLQDLLSRGILIRFSDKVIYHRDTAAELERIVLDSIEKNGSITIRDLRDALKFSRKYAQAILEHFDETGLTKRVEDKHIRGSESGG